jgi:hypothetical protein
MISVNGFVVYAYGTIVIQIQLVSIFVVVARIMTAHVVITMGVVVLTVNCFYCILFIIKIKHHLLKSIPIYKNILHQNFSLKRMDLFDLREF